MDDYRTIGEQILSGIFISLWLLSRPFIWIYRLIKWFIVSVFEETGRKMVKVTAILIVGAIVAFVASKFKF